MRGCLAGLSPVVSSIIPYDPRVDNMNIRILQRCCHGHVGIRLHKNDKIRASINVNDPRVVGMLTNLDDHASE